MLLEQCQIAGILCTCFPSLSKFNSVSRKSVFHCFFNSSFNLRLYGSCIHQLLAYADNVNILGGSIHTVKENAEAPVVATKKIGLEVNADKTKCMVMSREQTAGLSHTMKVNNSSIERVKSFKYLGTL